MKACNMCGGDMTSLGGGRYLCKYCGNEITEEERVPARSAPQPAVTVSANGGVNVFEKNVNGILEITCRFATCCSAGSGLLIDEQKGLCLTNTHVVTDDGKPCSDITVKIAGEKVKAAIVMLGDGEGGFGKGVDLALIRLTHVPKNAKPVTLADFNEVKIGEQVFVIGNSLGDGTCITSGIVSDKCRTLNGHKLLMTDCAINGGNSGGPIFNAEGLAIGVIVSSRVKSDGTATEGMNYAIPAFIVDEFLNDEHTAVRVSRGGAEGVRYARCPECGNERAVYHIAERKIRCGKCN